MFCLSFSVTTLFVLDGLLSTEIHPKLVNGLKSLKVVVHFLKAIDVDDGQKGTQYGSKGSTFKSI